MTCVLCGGSGHFATFRGGLKFWPCGVCFGAGVMWMLGPRIDHEKRKAKP